MPVTAYWPVRLKGELIADEITFGWLIDKTLTYGASAPDGTERTAEGTSLPQDGSIDGYYHATDANIVSGDVVIVKEGVVPVGWGQYNPNVLLASDGLDNISTTEPSGLASNFRDMLIQVFRRLFGKSTLTNSELKCYKENETDVATTQSVGDDGTTQTQGEAA